MSRRSRVLAASVAAALLAGAAVGVPLGFSREATPAISGADGKALPGSVASLEKVRIGGAEQWILVRGRDRAKPVLLFLHGGPGMPSMFLAHAWQRELERDFVVVHWDRRGTGKSFAAGADPAALTVRRTLDDAFELTRLLCARFGRERIYLAGHSWGSYLGLLAVREHPELYLAFVGIGQMAGSREEVIAARRAALERAAAGAGDAALAARMAAGAEISEDDLFRHGGELHAATSFLPILRAGLLSPEYGLADVWKVKRGADRVNEAMRYDLDPRPGEGEVGAVGVPVLFLLGRHDLNTPPELAEKYLDRLRAPLKGVAWFEESAHFPFFEEPARFAVELRRIDPAVSRFWSERAR